MLVTEFAANASSESPRTVAFLGACRISETFWPAVNSFDIRVVSTEFTSFVSSPGEALQYLEYSRGSVEIPEWLQPYVFVDKNMPTPSPALQQALSDADCYVIEISTLDQLRFGKIFFDWNELGIHFVRGKGPAHFRWWRELTDRSLRRPSSEAVEQVIQERSEAGLETPDEMRQFLSETSYETIDPQSLRNYLQMMSYGGTKKLIIVAEFNLASEGPLMIPERKALLETLRDAATSLGHVVFDPTPTLEAFGYQRALLADGVDIHHYTDAFKPEVGHAMLGFVSAALSGAGSTGDKSAI